MTSPSVPQSTTFQKNSDFTPTISPVQTVNISCNLVNETSLSNFPNVIYSTTPTVSIGQNIVDKPATFVYYKAIDGYFSNITVGFWDQLYRPIQLRDPNIQVDLILSPYGK